MEKYYCGVCKASYDTIDERAKCEAKCIEKRKADEEKRKKAELEKVKEARIAEVNQAYDNYRKLLNAYLNDYNEFRTFTNLFNLF